MTHICVGKPSIIGSDNGLWTAPSHYLNQSWNIVNWTLGNKLQWDFNRNSNIFIEENTFENVVCEMLFISSRPQCVKPCQQSGPLGYGRCLSYEGGLIQCHDYCIAAKCVVTHLILPTNHISSTCSLCDLQIKHQSSIIPTPAWPIPMTGGLSSEHDPIPHGIA